MAESVYIEDTVDICVDKDTRKSLKSIADSLKRIADVIDGTKVVEEEREKVRAELMEKMTIHCPKCGSTDLGLMCFKDPASCFRPLAFLRCSECHHMQEVRLDSDDLDLLYSKTIM